MYTNIVVIRLHVKYDNVDNVDNVNNLIKNVFWEVADILGL